MLLLAVLLLLGSAAAFTWTEKLKLEPPPVEATPFHKRFSPLCGCRRETARLSFVLVRGDSIDVEVVDKDAEVVRTLADGLERRPGRVKLDWDGRDADGNVVPDGAYRVRVRLERADRSVLLRRSVRVDTQPPHVQLRGVSATTFSRGGRGIVIRYTASEPGRLVLLVDGRRAVRMRVEAGASSLTWDGTFRSQMAAPGVHEVAFRMVDDAGNRSDTTEPVRVTVT
jgi:hypothetical protein